MHSNFDFFTDDAKRVIGSTAVTHEQATNNLAGLVMDYAEAFPISDDFRTMSAEGLICNLSEGYLPYCPRYILPDYQKLLDEGCLFLRLSPAKTLDEALTNLTIFYRHVPSVTHYPVFLGRLDKLLEPYLEGIDDEVAYHKIERFLFVISRLIPDSYCHVNLGPEATRSGHFILDAEIAHQEAVPSLTLLYDEDITPDDFMLKALRCASVCAKPSFANDQRYRQATGYDYGIASCYNALPIGGGALSLNRVMISNIAKKAQTVEAFFDELLPQATRTLMQFMDAKIKYMIEESHFFKSNFLVREGFIALDHFTAMVGIVGLSECVEALLAKDGIVADYANSPQSDALKTRVLQALTELLKAHESEYLKISDHHYLLHGQVGIAEDIGITPAIRIPIGQEPDLYTRLRHQAKYERYFPSGVGDIYPFDETAKRNPDAILDIIKGAFRLGLQYFSTYNEACDVVRVTGYLVKKSDLKKLEKQEAVAQANATWGYYAARNQHALDRRIEHIDADGQHQ